MQTLKQKLNEHKTQAYIYLHPERQANTKFMKSRKRACTEKREEKCAVTKGTKDATLEKQRAIKITNKVRPNVPNFDKVNPEVHKLVQKIKHLHYRSKTRVIVQPKSRFVYFRNIGRTFGSQKERFRPFLLRLALLKIILIWEKAIKIVANVRLMESLFKTFRMMEIVQITKFDIFTVVTGGKK